MTGRRKIEERIRRKEADIQELEAQLREARAYIQALQDVLKLLPRGDSGGDESSLRVGSAVSEARNAIQQNGKPMHISDLLRALGRDTDKKNRASLSGSLAAYVRRGEVFTRPAPNTFGLVEMAEESPGNQPPENFGLDDLAPKKDEEIPF